MNTLKVVSMSHDCSCTELKIEVEHSEDNGSTNRLSVILPPLKMAPPLAKENTTDWKVQLLYVFPCAKTVVLAKDWLL